MDTISIGKHNPRLADIRKAVQRGALTGDGLLPVEGPKLILEAQRSGISIVALFVREGLPAADLPPAAAVYSLDTVAFKTIQSTEHSQGLIALVKPRAWTLESILAEGSPIVVLAGVQDPGNVGTILRVSESFGAAGCIGLPGTARVSNSKVVRASAGSLFRLPHVWDVEWDTLVAALRSRKIPLLGTSPYGTDSITAWNWRRPSAVVIGNEGAGLSAAESKTCDAILKIPQESQAESLNSAVAAAVILYEGYRQRKLT